MRQLRQRCEREWLKTRLEIRKELYARQQERVVRIINSAKRDYFRIAIVSATPSDTYKIINGLMTNATVRSLPSHDSEQDLAHRFVQFFHCKVANIHPALDNIQQQLPPLKEEPLPAAVPILDSFSNVTSADLRKLVQGSASVLCMLDPAPARLLKESAVLDCVLPHMLRVVSESLESSAGPACLKIAVIIRIVTNPVSVSTLSGTSAPFWTFHFWAR